MGITMTACFDKTGINDLACFSEDTLVIKCLVETIEQSGNNFFGDKGLMEFRHGFAVRPRTQSMLKESDALAFPEDTGMGFLAVDQSGKIYYKNT